MDRLKAKFFVLVCGVGVSVLVFVNFPSSPYQEQEDLEQKGPKWTDHREIETRRVEWQKYANMKNGTTKSKRLPDIIGIGVEKCGTDAVITFLSLHPFVVTLPTTESHFYDSAASKKGLNYYRSLMPEAASHELIMEKTPSYFDVPPRDLPNIMHKDLPNVKLILILCEPVKRSFSDYTHERILANVLEDHHSVDNFPTFDSYLDVYLNRVKAMLSEDKVSTLTRMLHGYYGDSASTILTTGFYSLHLPRWTKVFDSKHLLIINGEDMLNDPGKQVERMQEFLDLPKLILARDFVRSPATGLFCIRPWWNNYDFESEWGNKSGWHRNLRCLAGSKGRTRHSKGHLNASEKHLAELKELYRPFNLELMAMTGIDY